MTRILRYAACMTIASSLFVAPASVGAQTSVEYGTTICAGQAVGTAADAAQNSPSSGLGGLGEAFGAAGGSVVSALGGDPADVDKAMAEQRERAQVVGAPC
jgi:hypothetical protein